MLNMQHVKFAYITLHPMARILLDVFVRDGPCDQDGFSFGYSLKLLICIEEREISDEEAVNTNDGPVSMVFTAPVQATLVTVSCKYSLHLRNPYNQPEENSYTKH